MANPFLPQRAAGAPVRAASAGVSLVGLSAVGLSLARLWLAGLSLACVSPASLSRRRLSLAGLGVLGLSLSILSACAPRAATPASAAPPPAAATHPDLSGFWNLDVKIPRDEALMKEVAPNTAFLDDTGPKEFPAGEYGGLQLKPAALEAVKKWSPYTQLSPENACKPPSIVYALQGPFPIEIFQSDKFIVMKLEYYDMVRMIFLDGRQPEKDFPDSDVGFSTGHWEGSTLVVETTHLEPATITNNGLDHTAGVRVLERFKLGADGTTLLATQEFEDPAVLDNRGVRFISWRKQPGQHVFPYECDPGFAGNYTPPPAQKSGQKPGKSSN